MAYKPPYTLNGGLLDETCNPPRDKCQTLKPVLDCSDHANMIRMIARDRLCARNGSDTSFTAKCLNRADPLRDVLEDRTPQ